MLRSHLKLRLWRSRRHLKLLCNTKPTAYNLHAPRPRSRRKGHRRPCCSRDRGHLLAAVGDVVEHRTAIDLPAPRGSFATGRAEFAWKNPTTGARPGRWIWYPAERGHQPTADGLPARWPGKPPALIKANPSRDRFFKREPAVVRTHSESNAPMASAQRTYPVVLLRPGRKRTHDRLHHACRSDSSQVTAMSWSALMHGTVVRLCRPRWSRTRTRRHRTTSKTRMATSPLSCRPTPREWRVADAKAVID